MIDVKAIQDCIASHDTALTSWNADELTDVFNSDSALAAVTKAVSGSKPADIAKTLLAFVARVSETESRLDSILGVPYSQVVDLWGKKTNNDSY